MLMRRRRDHLNQELGLGFGMSIYIRRHRMRLSDEVVNALLVVAGLILAAIFPYVYNPPGGFRPTSNNNESAAVSLNCNNVTINSTLQYANITSNPNIINARVAMGQGSFAFATIFTDTLFCVVLSVISFLLPDGSWQVARLEARKYVLMKGISSEYLDAQERSTVAAAADPTGEDEDMEAVAQTIPSASS
ncbi:hypothetical protein COLO4_36719 [Corchorus olitorius]|uniref:PGG domain-containing protein n=1 Tax=Corchorus olitorius TaxID=93759 RepID=A0A1R3G605_9ROSI|nr:hypothetical protein COLO4_36719 [Corchorus olitorius]